MTRTDYSALDRPEILRVIFYPRKERGPSVSEDALKEILIPVEEDVQIGSRLYSVERSAATILFFHGNGEIAADYHEMGQEYNQAGLNFWVVDYRGYGRSTGIPTYSSMMRDCHEIFKFVRDWRKAQLHSGPLIVMGRSLGSASALELAAHYKNWFSAAIVESGFAYLLPILQRLGVKVKQLGLTEAESFQNLEHIQVYSKPTLIIHAEQDHIVPFSDGQALYDACPSHDKRFLNIPKANHNTIFLYGKSAYMKAVKDLVESVIS